MPIYSADFEARIGFSAIRLRIAAMALCEAGRQQLLALQFSTDREWIAAEATRVEEMKWILRFHPEFPHEGYIDFGGALQILTIPTHWYREEDLHALRVSLSTLGEIIAFLGTCDATPRLSALSAEATLPEWILPVLGHVLTPSGQISDSASPQLQRIRGSMAALQGQIMRCMQNLLRDAQRDGLVDEGAQVMVREGHPVLPIPARNKSRFRAMVQGQSATGQTLFIEPYEALELANQMRTLEQEEHEEIKRILLEITDRLRPEHDALAHLCHFLGQIDSTRARALYALEVGGACPIMAEGCSLELRRAYHPALYETCRQQGREPIALNVRLDAEHRVLVISGPNAGGKSVALKCVAMAVYMYQCGFLPFVAENSELGVFDTMLLDIGDTQSIESDLSTYSAHLSAMSHFLQAASPRSICFIDEFGSGTEPAAGGAIAEAILECLAASGTLGIITTHFGNLKTCAEHLPGLLNGAMRYDLRTLRPLYQLEIDQPGSSFPFQIARQMGLPDAILVRAEELVGREYVSLETQLQEAMEARRAWEAKRGEIETIKREMESLQTRMDEMAHGLQAQRRTIIQQAKAEAQRIIRDSNKAVERTIREIREAAADKEATRQIRTRLKSHLDALEKEDEAPSSPAPSLPEQPADASPTLAVGVAVRIHGSDSVGEIVTLSPKKAVVAMGHMYTTVPLSQLEPLPRAQYRKMQRAGNQAAGPASSDGLRQRRLNFSSSLDVRGQRGEEALQSVQELLDDAILVGVQSVRILHGKGDGILRTRIRDLLKEHPAVQTYHDEAENFGGAGITVVELK